MSILYEERASDSPYVATIMRGYTASDGCTTRPAESGWHMVFVWHTKYSVALVRSELGDELVDRIGPFDRLS